MPDVELGNTNTADNETTIEAQGDSFIGDSVFRADARTAEGRPRINGLRGDGIHGGAGAIGGGGNPQQTATVPAAGPGVIGRGGPVGDRHPGLRGAGVIGVGTDFRDAGPEESAGVGVFGIGAFGVVGNGIEGAGVVGACGLILIPDAKTTGSVGVYGMSGVGPGVVGIGGGPINPEHRGSPGVVGSSGSGPGGEFDSEETGQVRLVPSKRKTLPTLGLRGDLWVQIRPGRAGSKLRQPSLSLFMCVQDSPDVRWQKVLLDPARLKGGTVAP